MIVFAFDRDDTLDVNPHHRKEPMVPMEWVRYLAHETEHEVWATGNQALKAEAEIPGEAEAMEHLEIEKGDFRPPRRNRVRMLGEMFPEADRYIVIDDVDLSFLEEWEHYYPWTFVEAVQAGELEIGLSETMLAD